MAFILRDAQTRLSDTGGRTAHDMHDVGFNPLDPDFSRTL